MHRHLLVSYRPVLAAVAALACLLALAAPMPADAAGRDTGPVGTTAPSSAPTAGRGVQAGPDEVVPGSLIVTHEAGADVRRRLPAAAAAAAVGLGRAGVEPLGPGAAQVTVPPAAAEAARQALLAVPGVIAVEPDRVLGYASTGTTAAPDDPLFAQQWAHESPREVPGAADARAGWKLATGTRSLVIAIIDSGIDADHEDLAGAVAEQWHVTDRVRSGSAALCESVIDGQPELAFDHGTMVAGVAAAQGSNGTGVTGAVWRSSVLDYQISTPGSCAPTDAKVIRALDHVAGRSTPAHVVNLSLGGPQPEGVCPRAMQDAIDRVRSRGTAVVAASGNDGGYAFQTPAGCRGVLAVGAVRASGERAAFSSMGAYLDIAAPGDGVLTTRRGGDTYATVSGTSFAAPYVAGAIALMQELAPARVGRRLTPDELEGTLEATADHPLGPGQHDERTGWGRLRLGQALAAVQARDISLPRAARVSPGTGTTEPIAQSIAVSRRTFDAGTARWAVIGRGDDYPDALAGSSLAFGVGPLLFAPRTGSLPRAVVSELRRALPRHGCSDSPSGRCIVYLLGGSAALDPRLDDEVAALGFQPVRLAGETREETAVAVADEVRRAVARYNREPVRPHREFILATRGNWPDAVAAGSLGSTFGVPVLLTEASRLHPATAAYLASSSLAARSGYAVGGNVVIADATAQAAADAAGLPGVVRLGGAARDATAVSVAVELERRLDGLGYRPSHAIAIDLDRRDAFAHALSASVVAGNTLSVFIPVRGPEAGQRLTDHTLGYACDLDAEALMAGDVDLLPESLGFELRAVLRGESARC